MTFCFVLIIFVKAVEDFGFFNLLRDRVEKLRKNAKYFSFEFFDIFSCSVFTYSGTHSLKCLGF